MNLNKFCLGFTILLRLGLGPRGRHTRRQAREGGGALFPFALQPTTRPSYSFRDTTPTSFLSPLSSSTPYPSISTSTSPLSSSLSNPFPPFLGVNTPSLPPSPSSLSIGGWTLTPPPRIHP